MRARIDGVSTSLRLRGIKVNSEDNKVKGKGERRLTEV